MTESPLSWPRWQRASDIRTLTLEGCELGLVLSWLYEPDYANWFILGSGAHYAIEMAITHDLDQEDAVYEGWLYCQRELTQAKAKGLEILTAYRSKRTPETMKRDLEEVVQNWFTAVHPDSKFRMEVYNDYDWPPKVEHMITLPEINLYTSTDAIFTGGPKGEEVAIVDWKTGSKASAPRSQLDTYAYGGRKEGWMPKGQKFVGWFHHLTANKLQRVERYVGDAVVGSWLHAAEMRKESIASAAFLPVAANTFQCAKTNPNNKNCPVCGPEETRPKVTDLLGRLADAKLELQPREISERD